MPGPRLKIVRESVDWWFKLEKEERKALINDLYHAIKALQDEVKMTERMKEVLNKHGLHGITYTEAFMYEVLCSVREYQEGYC